jgi:dynein heavy chain
LHITTSVKKLRKQSCRYYHAKSKFAHLLSILSNEIVRISKDVVGNEILNDPNSVGFLSIETSRQEACSNFFDTFFFPKSYIRLKDAVKLCAMFRGTYIDFKEKADILNKKYYTAEKKSVFVEKHSGLLKTKSSKSLILLEKTDLELLDENKVSNIRMLSFFEK